MFTKNSESAEFVLGSEREAERKKDLILRSKG